MSTKIIPVKFRDLRIGARFKWAAACGGPFEKISPTWYRIGDHVEHVGCVTVGVEEVQEPTTFDELWVGDVFDFVGTNPTPGIARLRGYQKTSAGGYFPDDERTGSYAVTLDRKVAVRRAKPAPYWSKDCILFVRLDAGHDSNGNPRRGLQFLSRDGDVLATLEEGYSSIPDWVRRAKKAGRIGEGPTYSVKWPELRDAFKVAPVEVRKA